MMKAIGGYFELALPEGTQYYRDAAFYQSARAGFLALLRAGAPKKIWMPRYLCDSMIAPVKLSGIECSFYSINPSFEVVEQIKLAEGDWLLYPNYFGIHEDKVALVLSRYNRNAVIIDNSQAFYSQPQKCLATIYSPRKFFGIPDGGLVLTDIELAQPAEEDTGSVGRLDHLLKRLIGSPESGFADYQRAEKSLEDMEPRRMSLLTRSLLACQDHEAARMKRNENFSALHDLLGSVNQLKPDISSLNGPLSYPLLTESVPDLRQRLIVNRIFVPMYWPEVLNRTTEESFEAKLVRSCVPVPCDQRYDLADMAAVASLIKAVAGR